MNRHIYRRGAAGFSFVELLVTIIIAGIAFSALVPLFVMANRNNSGDNLRVQSTQVAQDKIEKIRQLPYGSIAADAAHPTTVPNLYNDSKLSDGTTYAFADGQFGPTAELSSGHGSRVIRLAYTVQPYPATTTGLQSEYKIVTVTATWDAPPSPVKPTVLSTIVYRQYAGPPIASMALTPGLSDEGILGDENLSTVLIRAHVDLSAGAVPAYIQFTINGPSAASQKVLVTETNSASDYWYDGNGNFFWRWACATVPNGSYDIFATAFSTDGFVGNTFHLYPIIDHVVPVAPPASVIASPGDTTVDLDWNDSLEPDLTGYELRRSATDALGPWDSPTITVTGSLYADTGLSNGTMYYYEVRTLTSDGRSPSTWTASNPVTPSKTTDETPPTAPTGLTAVAAGGAATINLSWTAATDPGTPSSGLKLYEIFRSADGTTWDASAWETSTSTTFPDATAGYSATWYYKVRAVDNANLRSPFSGVAHNSTPTIPLPHHNLKISVKKGTSACYVWVLYATTGQAFSQHFFSKAGADLGANPVSPGTLIAKNGSVTFLDLPDGNYTVWTNTGSGYNLSTNKLQPGAALSGADNLTYEVTP